MGKVSDNNKRTDIEFILSIWAKNLVNVMSELLVTVQQIK
ncbi:hypothetical protein JCM19231_702 [Vibrio ishigakensis]|uniref:Uncharacterized protein n=1 Tax=Vibrio ishigakensis TaxID=1481914 RepID=A0A0B8P7S0_9VIBR|nr:hypothetical protein JCM19231_702 [Vibrio ishigakensis]